LRRSWKRRSLQNETVRGALDAAIGAFCFFVDFKHEVVGHMNEGELAATDGAFFNAFDNGISGKVGSGKPFLHVHIVSS
jgi:hypothetical protein